MGRKARRARNSRADRQERAARREMKRRLPGSPPSERESGGNQRPGLPTEGQN